MFIGSLFFINFQLFPFMNKQLLKVKFSLIIDNFIRIVSRFHALKHFQLCSSLLEQRSDALKFFLHIINLSLGYVLFALVLAFENIQFVDLLLC